MAAFQLMFLFKNFKRQPVVFVYNEHIELNNNSKIERGNIDIIIAMMSSVGFILNG